MSIDFEVDKDGVATVTINRAEVHNALDAEHYAAISKAWQTVRDDPRSLRDLTGAATRP
jgi:E-phenylitaconyl-CoA hydratase